MTSRIALLTVAGLLAAATPAGASPRAGADLLPHRAYYTIKLQDADWGANIAGLDGKLVVEFNDACDGFTLNQRFVTELSDSEGNVVVSDLWLTSWEAADGRSFRFNMKNEVGGRVVEDYEGRATATDQGGRVDYDGGVTDIDLPQGTMFPTRHSFDLVNAALANDRSLSRVIFDGSGKGEIYSSYATIGPEYGAGFAKDGLAGVSGIERHLEQRAWPVVISYFKLGSSEELPDYEISFVMYESGMSSDLVMRYGDFSVTGQLEKVEVLDRPRCR